MATPSHVPVDVDTLRSEIEKTYTEVSTEPAKGFIFPTGRAWAEQLGYPQPELSRVPDATVGSFAGVANHFTLDTIEPGAVVLDLGCGAGTDLLIAAQMAGTEGRVVGVDMTRPMLERARESAHELGLENVELHGSLIESLPLDDESVDVVMSNGVVDLVPDKAAVFAEIDRVLRPGGRVQLADVVIHEEVSADARERIDLWTGWIAGALLEGEHARILVGMGYREIRQGDLVDTFSHSQFEDTRRKARKFGAMGSTIRAVKPQP